MTQTCFSIGEKPHWTLFCIKSFKVSFKCKNIASYFPPSLSWLPLYLAVPLTRLSSPGCQGPCLIHPCVLISSTVPSISGMCSRNTGNIKLDTLYLISLLYEAVCVIGTAIQDRYLLMRRQRHLGPSSFSGHYLPHYLSHCMSLLFTGLLRHTFLTHLFRE